MLTPPSITEIRRPTTREEEIQKDARTIQAVREPANMRTLADFSAFFLFAAFISRAHDGKRRDPVPPLPEFRHLLSLSPMPKTFGPGIYGLLRLLWPMSGLARLQES